MSVGNEVTDLEGTWNIKLETYKGMSDDIKGNLGKQIAA
jgi:hypothetical protein